MRRPKAHTSTTGLNILHYRNPWVVACWSVLFPGFGNILTGNYIKGFLLIVWEIIVNVNAKINLAILYSFTGRFDLAKTILDKRWLLLYCTIYIYSIWESYRLTIEYNKFSTLADRENSPLIPFKMGTFAINVFDKRDPWLAAAWSSIMPGAGALYVQRVPTGFFVLIWWIIITYKSHALESIHFTFLHQFAQATSVVDFQWLLFMPSIYIFSIFDSYTSSVEYNKIFEIEQSRFLKSNYQSSNFEMPI